MNSLVSYSWNQDRCHFIFMSKQNQCVPTIFKTYNFSPVIFVSSQSCRSNTSSLTEIVYWTCESERYGRSSNFSESGPGMVFVCEFMFIFQTCFLRHFYSENHLVIFQRISATISCNNLHCQRSSSCISWLEPYCLLIPCPTQHPFPID